MSLANESRNDRNLGIILIATICLTFVASAFAQETLWEELTNRADELYQQGKYSEAEEVYYVYQTSPST